MRLWQGLPFRFQTVVSECTLRIPTPHYQGTGNDERQYDQPTQQWYSRLAGEHDYMPCVFKATKHLSCRFLFCRSTTSQLYIYHQKPCGDFVGAGFIPEP